MGSGAGPAKIILSGGRMKKIEFRLETFLGSIPNGRVFRVAGHIPYKMTGPEALAASIQKWKFIVASIKKSLPHHIITDGGTDTCGLCWKFQYNTERACTSCPVRLKSRQRFCAGTPYAAFVEAVRNMQESEGVPKKNISKLWASRQLKAAREELKFLQSLKVK
jgi:hypothetical protein